MIKVAATEFQAILIDLKFFFANLTLNRVLLFLKIDDFLELNFLNFFNLLQSVPFLDGHVKIREIFIYLLTRHLIDVDVH